MKRRDFLKGLIALPLASFLYPLPSIKPAEKKSFMLLDSPVAGFSYYEGEEVWNRLRRGASLSIVREPQNPYDDRAVEVYWRGNKIGYIPKEENSLVAGMMDRGEKLKTRISWLNQSNDPWKRIGIRVEMET